MTCCRLSFDVSLSLIRLHLQVIKPTVLIGSSGVGKTFTKEVIEAVTSINEVNSYLFLHMSICVIL